jgi:hypothetical protein
VWSNWRKHITEDTKVDSGLLWEYNLENFDWQDMKTVVVQRVIERGTEEDFFAIFKLYGGKKGVREIIKNIPYMSSQKDIAFVCLYFDLKKEELLGYTRPLLREKLLSSFRN